MGLTIKRDTSLEKIFDKFATLPDEKSKTDQAKATKKDTNNK